MRKLEIGTVLIELLVKLMLIILKLMKTKLH